MILKHVVFMRSFLLVLAFTFSLIPLMSPADDIYSYNSMSWDGDQLVSFTVSARGEGTFISIGLQNSEIQFDKAHLGRRVVSEKEYYDLFNKEGLHTYGTNIIPKFDYVILYQHIFQGDKGSGPFT